MSTVSEAIRSKGQHETTSKNARGWWTWWSWSSDFDDGQDWGPCRFEVELTVPFTFTIFVVIFVSSDDDDDDDDGSKQALASSSSSFIGYT